MQEQRKIKFRVWSTYFNRFFDEGFKIYLSGNVDDIDDIHHDHEMILQQFTGLLDKNRVEIFEGDILKIIDHPTNVENHIAPVVFTEGVFRTEWSSTPVRDWGSCWVEVCGNIFENKDLLEKAKN